MRNYIVKENHIGSAVQRYFGTNIHKDRHIDNANLLLLHNFINDIKEYSECFLYGRIQDVPIGP